MGFMRFLMMAALCLLPLHAEVKAKNAFDKPTLEAYVRHLLVLGPQVEIKIDDPKPGPVPELKQIEVHLNFNQFSQDETLYATKDGLHIMRGNVYGIAGDPFQPELDKLKLDKTPSYGTPGAPIVLVDFADFECPLCKDEALALRKNLLVEFPAQVRFYFKDFPLIPIHPWAKPAAIAGRCVFRQSPDAFWQYHDWLYEHQADITAENLNDKINEFAKANSAIDTMQLLPCLADKAAEAEVDKQMAEGKALHVTGTPTLYVNGRPLVGNVPWEQLKALIKAELEYQKTAKAAAEACCEVKIPSPLNK